MITLFPFIESLKIGIKFQIQFDVRAQEKAGTLFHVDGNGDRLTITLEEDGSIKVVCNNGGGLFSVSYKPETSICNGDIYSVLLQKEGKTLKLTVNGVMTEETTSKSASSADTKSPAYFGGVPSKWSIPLRVKGFAEQIFKGHSKKYVCTKMADF